MSLFSKKDDGETVETQDVDTLSTQDEGSAGLPVATDETVWTFNDAGVSVPVEDDDLSDEEKVAAFFAAEEADDEDLEDDEFEKLSTVLPLPTLSGYPEGSYPEAQAAGVQFDKGDGKVNPIATGKQEEAALVKDTSTPGSVEKDAVGNDEPS